MIWNNTIHPRDYPAAKFKLFAGAASQEPPTLPQVFQGDGTAVDPLVNITGP